MDKDLKIKRRNGARLRSSEIEEMIFLSLTSGVSPDEVAKANEVDLQKLLFWQAEYRAAGMRRLRGLPSPAEITLHEKITAQNSYIKELERILNQKEEEKIA